MSHSMIEFDVGGSFFSFFSLSFTANYSLILLVVDISTFVLILMISNFWSRPFYTSFICFKFHPSISIYQILYLPIWSSFFRFLIFIIGPFVKILVVFNFIIQFKLMILYFLIWCSLLFFSISPFNYNIVFFFCRFQSSFFLIFLSFF
jgi:hypothetical protein